MKIKLGFSLFLSFLVFVFITQNAESVQVNFIIWSIDMSLVLLVFIMLGAGVMIGWFLSSYFRFARNRQQNNAKSVEPVKKNLVEKEKL